MADADNLDNLSNVELRARMLAQGLPNIPVTDSSRKVLVKRLRASLGGNAALPSASPKKSGRELLTREYIAAAAAPAPAPAAASQLDKPIKSRRTIAVNPSDTKEDERRRQTQPVNKPQTVPEAIAVVKPVPTKGASIQSRRLSSSERREKPKEQIVRKPEPIVEEPTVPKKLESEKPLLVNSLIVLESDEEEDEQLAQAVQDAEDQYSEHKRQFSSKPKPKAKLTATTVNTHEYVAKPLYPSLQSNTAEQQRLKQIYEHAPSPTQPRAALAASSSSSSSSSNTYDYRAATGRYSSYVSSPAQSYTSASSTLGYSSTLRRSPPRIFSNEFSDDTADEDVQGGKFESDFARNLARMRAERLGDRTASYRRSVNPGSSITGARRSLRQEQQSSSTALIRLWQTLDNKYNLKSKLFILIVLLVLFAVYRFFY